jgi:hypothetical protein
MVVVAVILHIWMAIYLRTSMSMLTLLNIGFSLSKRLHAVSRVSHPSI